MADGGFSEGGLILLDEIKNGLKCEGMYTVADGAFSEGILILLD